MAGAVHGWREPSPRVITPTRRELPWYSRVRKFPAQTTHYLRWKRTFDIIISLLLLPALLPLIMLCCAVIVIDSPGYPIFSQLRTGTCGRRFRMFKLRTMVRDAEAHKDRLGNLNELTWPDFKITNDPRVTRAGKLLRKTSLDELPQIFNVLRGDMSLVGPRPTSFSSSTYSTWHTARLDVQSGVTGLWQIEGRNDIDFDERVRLDIAYARHCSFSLDFLILLRTIPRVVSGRGAN
jgi:lipopolysaccharide/colanic/teichoic acid biosynthesis glycosyltransferase